MKPTSNIVRFMDYFDIDGNPREGFVALTYLFGRGTTVEGLATVIPQSSLQKGVVERVRNSGKLYEAFGFKAR